MQHQAIEDQVIEDSNLTKKLKRVHPDEILSHTDEIPLKKFRANILFGGSRYESNLLKQNGQWLIRESSTNQDDELNFVFAICEDGQITKVRLKKEELINCIINKKAICTNGTFNLIAAHLISPTEHTVSKKWLVTNDGNVISSKPNINDYVVNGFLKPYINPELIIDYMKNDARPSVVIYRIDDQGKKFDCTIGEPNNYFSASYEIAYLRNNNTVSKIPFRIYTNDSKKIKEGLCKFLSADTDVFVPEELKQKKEVFRELEVNQATPKIKCGLIYVHRNKAIFPEEFIHITQNVTETLIISVQTPSEEARICHYDSNSQSGGTACEIQRILSKPVVTSSNQKWVIVTGHHGGHHHALSGSYIHTSSIFKQNAEKTNLIIKVDELKNLLMECGYRKGDHINILLYVCSAATAMSDDKSFAKQLAYLLAEEGISSTIVASKNRVGRFDGRYEEDEIERECLRFRTKNEKGEPAPEAVVVITGTPGDSIAIEEKLNQYPHGFYITPYGLGQKNDLIPSLQPKNHI